MCTPFNFYLIPSVFFFSAIHPYDAKKVVDVADNAMFAMADFGDAIYLGIGALNVPLPPLAPIVGLSESGLYYMNPSTGATALVASGEQPTVRRAIKRFSL
jgi:hypothetical protein